MLLARRGEVADQAISFNLSRNDAEEGPLKTLNTPNPER